MSQESLQIQLFERIKNEARWLRLRPDIFNDVVQEAWILALDYADQKDKKLEDISKTEIKFRCLEAKRNIVQPYKEISVEEEWFSSAPVKIESVKEIVNEKPKTTLLPQNQIERLDWLLNAHPALRLTDRQADMYQIMIKGEKRGWQTKYAQENDISRQAVSKAAAIVKNKIGWANNLLQLIDGDIDYFFDQYGYEWKSPILKKILRALFRPQLGTEIDPKLTEILKTLKESFLKKSTNLLKKELAKLETDEQLNPKNMILGVNIFYLADNIDHTSLDEEIAKEIWEAGKNAGPFMDIAFGLYDYLYEKGNWVKRYNKWLEERFKVTDDLGLGYAQYHVTHYNATTQAKVEEFVIARKPIDIKPLSYTRIISNTYNNMRTSFYADNTDLLDMNFLRLIIIKKYYPIEIDKLSKNSLQALKTIAQKSMQSNNSFVSEQATKLLSTLKGL